MEKLVVLFDSLPGSILLLSICSGVLFCLAASCLPADDDAETAGIRAAVQNYFEGTYYADEDKIRRAFHTDAHITGCLDGLTVDWTLTEFIKRILGQPSQEENDEPFDKRIVYLDRAGNAAIVKAEVKVGGFTFVDYITMLKVKGEWKIRNKSFTTM